MISSLSWLPDPEPPDRPAAAAGTAARILNVNDSEAARYVITRMLQRAGFVVTEAASGLQALQELEREVPDLVLLDVQLPDLDGYEVCRRIRANPRTAGIKVLHTSATFVTLDNKVQSLDGGADGYLTQPFEQEELTATLRSLLRLREAEAELRESADQLREADRRKDEFLAMLGHELRNPLAAIAAALPVALRRPPEDAAERRARDVLNRQMVHLSRIIDDLLDVARVTQGKIELRRERLDLLALLARVAASVRETRTESRRQTTAMRLPSGPVVVSGDVTRLEQVFINLLDNASKYSDVGGHIEIEVSVIDDETAARLDEAEGHSPRASREPFGWARVVVRDDGVGMEPEVLPGIFGLFAQANVSIARSRGGLGVGLTLARTLSEMHGGRVTARSPGRNRGSEFEVRLPLAAASGAAARPSPPASSAVETNASRRVLIVEDNTDAQQALADLCELLGHQVATANDGQQALQRAREFTPDVAFVDIGLPGMSGYDVARALREQETEAPRDWRLRLVALSGYGSREHHEQSIACGFDLHVVKPITADRLKSLLEQPLTPVPERK